MNRYAVDQPDAQTGDWWTSHAPASTSLYSANAAAVPRNANDVAVPRKPTSPYPNPYDPIASAPPGTLPPSGTPPPPLPTPNPNAGTSADLAAALKNRDWQGVLRYLSSGQYQNPAGKDPLKDSAFVKQLTDFGFKISPANAVGEVTKIQTPDGHWVRVLGGPKSAYQWTWVDNGPEGAAPPVGAVPPNFGTPLPLPENLRTPYVAPTWTGGEFHVPTMAEVEATPGYQERFAMGAQASDRSAAAKGTVLAGGQQKALTRYGQDYATNEFQNTFANNYQTYLAKYGQFMDAANLGLGARNQNVNEFMMNYGIDHTRQTDYWSRLRDLYGIGADTATNSKPAGS